MYSELAVWSRIGNNPFLVSFQIFAVDVAELLSFWVFTLCCRRLCGMIPHPREPNCHSEGADNTLFRNVRTSVSSYYTKNPEDRHLNSRALAVLIYSVAICSCYCDISTSQIPGSFSSLLDRFSAVPVSS